MRRAVVIRRNDEVLRLESMESMFFFSLSLKMGSVLWLMVGNWHPSLQYRICAGQCNIARDLSI